MKVAAQPAEPVSSMTRPLVPATSTRPGPKDAIARRFLAEEPAEGTLIRHRRCRGLVVEGDRWFSGGIDVASVAQDGVHFHLVGKAVEESPPRCGCTITPPVPPK